jgi:hypothetical protein
LPDEGKARAKQVEPPKLSVTAERDLFSSPIAGEEVCGECFLYVLLVNDGYAIAHIGMVLVEGLGRVFLISSRPVVPILTGDRYNALTHSSLNRK